MSLSYPNPTNSSSKKPVRWRLIAILIMVAGAIGFAIGLLVFDQQILCLALSTLLTLAGLGLNITARRKGWTSPQESGEVKESRSAAAARWLRRSRAPRGLRGSPRSVPVQAPMAVPPSDAKKTVMFGPIPGSLPDRVITILEAQGAKVTVESKAEGRGILGITTEEGQRYIAMILESGSPVDVRDVRSLLALIRGSGSVRGYLISSGRITQPAYQWAQGRPQIRLVQEDELDELSI